MKPIIYPIIYYSDRDFIITEDTKVTDIIDYLSSPFSEENRNSIGLRTKLRK